MGHDLPAAILSALDRGLTVLTPNQRAARTLRHAYDLTRRKSSVATWTPPEILPLDTWLAARWHHLLLTGAETRLLLSPIQEHSLWRNIIADDREVPTLRSTDALAETAARAFHALALHNGLHRLRDFAVSTDARAFARWARTFEQTCTRNAYITSAQLPTALPGTPNTPGVLLVDFDALTPAHTGLFNSLERSGVPVEHFRTAIPAQSSSLFSAEDDPSELRTAALWARDHLASNPDATIAIVVPNLAECRSQIDRVFSEILPDRGSYEFSLGLPLADTAPVVAALDILRWSFDSLPLQSISNLLLSPFFAAADPEEALAAAEFDVHDLRRAQFLRPELTLASLTHLVRHSRRAARLPLLIRHLRALERTAESFAGISTQSHTAWADAFRDLLESAGWNSAAQSLSLHFQTLRRWESALDTLSTLDFDTARVSAAGALGTLERIARQTIFAPESNNAPIQVLGPLELGGTTFDALWFFSADDQTWPASQTPHALIPWHIQRDLGMPGSDPGRDNELAQRLTQRLAGTAPEIVFSYALHAEDGERRPSPLLKTLNLTELAEPPTEPARTAQPLLTFADTEPLPPLPEGITPGGARILQLQAACAFRAFAEIRLYSAEPETRTPGLDARARGVQVHQVMQQFWEQIRDQETLRSLPLPERNALLDTAIDHALTEAANHAQTSWDHAYIEVQRRRLRALLEPWLDFELTRPPFADRQQEEQATATIGPLSLHLRADRIDDTEGGPLILDYKTGRADPRHWLSDRPDEPQLPLYAVLNPPTSDNPELGGLAFAILRPGEELALKGFAADDRVLTKSARNPLSLPQQLDEWRRILTDLATAFASEDPIASPKSYPNTCKHCGQRILCRLDPATLEDLTDEPEEDLTPIPTP